MSDKAKKIVAEIKKIVRDKPTAANAYGLKAWEGIEFLIDVALANSPAADESAKPVDISVQMENLRRRSNALFPGKPDEPASTASKEAATLSDEQRDTLQSALVALDPESICAANVRKWLAAAQPTQRDASKAEGQS
jgi:hypothetical protein